jgi:hypothetical protein
LASLARISAYFGDVVDALVQGDAISFMRNRIESSPPPIYRSNAQFAPAENTTGSTDNRRSIRTCGAKFQWRQKDDRMAASADLTFIDQACCSSRLEHPGTFATREYTLTIDDRVIGYLSREQLAAGVNLAMYATPMQSQAGEVDGIEQQRIRLDEANFILSIEDPKIPDAANLTHVIASKNDALISDQHTRGLSHCRIGSNYAGDSSCSTKRRWRRIVPAL